MNQGAAPLFHRYDREEHRAISDNDVMIPNLATAQQRTAEARARLEQIENLLFYAFGKKHAVNWDELKCAEKFPVCHPEKQYRAEFNKIWIPAEPEYYPLPPKPEARYFKPDLNIFDKLFNFLGNRKRKHAKELLNKAKLLHLQKQEEVKHSNQLLRESYKRKLEVARTKISILGEECAKETALWEEQQTAFYKEQQAYNKRVDMLKANYLRADVNAISEYNVLVLSNSKYPETFPKDFDLEYRPADKLLVVGYMLPVPEQLPKLREVKYIATRNELEEYFLSEVQQAKLYESAIYQIALRTLQELFEADQIEALQRIAFNGRVKNLEEPNGKIGYTCKVSIIFNREEFEAINLSDIDFSNWSWLKYYSPVQAVAQTGPIDKHFLSSYDLAVSPIYFKVIK
ncbi:hypothetical protein H8S90_14825 [Olivibacter sp. SDN3]|uniref:hypothetical protein n=1 Tax=Olivibacter sp. SDN3 TaxID=2764720 RepID=UPI00165179D3|nr:hypothetical protein [Olivibacter sp. SDN3]QNL48080.1 hypothetical protein H8S90_14825 [Olivibacter sp. SDN3]